MTKYKRDIKSGFYYAYVPTGYINLNGMPEYKKIRAKSLKSLEEKINTFGGKN